MKKCLWGGGGGETRKNKRGGGGKSNWKQVISGLKGTERIIAVYIDSKARLSEDLKENRNTSASSMEEKSGRRRLKTIACDE